MTKELPSKILAISILRDYFDMYISEATQLDEIEKHLINATKGINPRSKDFDSFVDKMQELWKQFITDYTRMPYPTLFSFHNMKLELRQVSMQHDTLMVGLRLAQKRHRD